MLQKEMLSFIKERHSITLKRAAGKLKPWTKDPILQTYRFCSVYRELDTVTQWIATNWREPHEGDPHLWFAMVVARLFNKPETLEAMDYPVPWQSKSVMKYLQHCRDAGFTTFNGAYIVSTNGIAMDKIEYVCKRVLDPLWKERKALTLKVGTFKGTTLAAAHADLMAFQGLGSFMAAQVIADLKYVEPLQSAPDWYSWAASGPGSRRGLNRVLGRAVDAPWKELYWLEELNTLQTWLNARWPWDLLHAQDVQNCLCEFDKYMRVKLGEGRPKQLYKGV